MQPKYLYILFFFLTFAFPSYSQEVLWQEDFDGLANNLIKDQAPTAWKAYNKACPEKLDNDFGTEYGRFAIKGGTKNCDGLFGKQAVAVFETEEIDITGKGLVRVYLRAFQEGAIFSNEEYLKCSYRLDGGPLQSFAEIKGKTGINKKTGKLESASFQGKKVQIVVEGSSSWLSKYSFDDISVITVGSLPSTYSQIVVREPIVAIQDEKILLNASSDSVLKQTTYLDGLGREKQTVSYQTSPKGEDVVSFREYNNLGKEPVSYLPFVGGTDGLFKSSAQDVQAKFYLAAPEVAQNTHPYAEIVQEQSPLGRVLEQGSIGETWQIEKDKEGNSTAQGKTLKYAYRSNEANELLQWKYEEEKNTLWFDEGIYHPAATLSMQEVKNEAGYRMRIYTNSLGQTVAQAQEKSLNEFIYTYSFYDALGNLLVVLPPGAIAATKAQGLTQLESDFLDKWCFQYHYDEKGKFLLSQKAPGAGWTSAVYDKWGRLLLSQDARQRIQNKWHFYQYDFFGRVVLEGSYETKLSQEELQTAAQNLDSLKYASFSKLVLPHGYSEGHYPFVNPPSFANEETEAGKGKIINFYDDYRFFDLFKEQVQPEMTYTQQLNNPAAETKVLGQLTGRKVKIASTKEYLYEVYYYDKEGRLLQTVYTDHLGGVHRVTSAYDFIGKVLQTLHQYEGVEKYTLLERYEYDPKGRLLATYHKINEEAEEQLASYAYNALGQVTAKKLGDGLQTLKYDYHLKGWLSALNKNMQPTDLFKLNLKYETPAADGNLSEQWWQSKLDNIPRGYSYAYDPLQRLESASYGHKNENVNEKFSLPNITYDDNGNILSLQRENLLKQEKGEKPVFGLVDELTYQYEGNQLKIVEDKIESQSAAGDFENKNIYAKNPVTEYIYDPNGNLVEDKNKGIYAIVYNDLNLPTSIYFDKEGENKIDYLYDAAGNKLQKIVYKEGKASTTDYLYPFVYQNQDLAFINTSEGRVLSPKAMQSETHGYEYHIRDHLGSLRVAFRKGNTYSYLATMEEANAQTEELMFDNLKETRDKNYACTGASASKLNQKQMMGPWKSLYVNKGDSVQIEVKALYVEEAQNQNPISLLAYVNNLQNFTPSKESGNSLPLLQLGLGYVPQPQKEDQIPVAYLRYILYDKDSNYVTSELVQVTSAAFKSCELLQLALQVPQDGYMQIFVANESEVATYFDDLEIKLQESLIAQEIHYDPWGLPLKGIERTNAYASKFTYNGKEYQNELGLNWQDYGFRYYDVQLGKWHSADPMADLYHNLSPYNYVFNNPLNWTDPDGRCPDCDQPDGQGIYTSGSGKKYFKNDEGEFVELPGLLKNVDITGKPEYSPHVDFGFGSDLFGYGAYEGGGYNNYKNNRESSTGGDRDGYLTFGEAKFLYQYGQGAPRYVDLNKIDLSKVTLSDFKKDGTAEIRLDGKHFSNPNDALVHGTIILERIENTNIAQIARNSDLENKRGGMYNFEMHDWTIKSTFRNVITWGAEFINGIGTYPFAPPGAFSYTGGTPYPIYYKGAVTIPR